MSIVAGTYEVSEALSIEQLLDRLQEVLSSPASGKITVSSANGTPIGNLRFKLGRLFWATGGQHRWRRWDRLTKQLVPQLEGVTPPPGTSEDDWEYQVLVTGLNQRKISQEQAVALLEQTILESLFDIIQGSQAGCKFSNTLLSDSSTDILSVQNGLALLNQAQESWQAWQAAGLSNSSPDAAPVVRNAAALQQRTSPQTYQTLTNLLNGKSTLRELAVVMRQDLKMLTQTLLAYAQWELIGLETLADIERPGRQGAIASQAAPGIGEPSGSGAAPPGSSDAPLIMCIDDNPKVCEMLEKILTSAGYQYVGVQDSLQALPVLLERKPDFIFLDLVMPVASGYEVCSQIRRISSFKDVPVVILTGNDGIIDRIRSKASGSTDFISKPLDVAKVLATIRHYIPDRVPSAA